MSTAERLEQLRDLPRVTVADRERYKRWEQESRAELAEVEPTSTRLERAYLQAAMLRKLWLVLHRPGEGDVPITRAEWHSHWRSLPDYDGPPMRAPSGVGYWTHREITPFEHAAAAELGITQEPDDARKDEHGNLILARWVTENLFAVIADLRFALPSAGGRGWCRGLAGVSE